MKTKQGFTLIEMLVVVAILALLISLIVPGVSRVMERSRTVHCASNMRQLGQVMMQYATDHGGRWPGKAYRTNPTNASISWAVMLDEYSLDGKVKNIMGTGKYNKPSQILCVSKRKFKGNYSRNYVMNGAAAGGTVSSSTPNGNGMGLMQNPAKNPDWSWHMEGAMVIASQRPSEQFLIVETERATDYIGPRWPYGNLTLGDDPNYPPWSAKGGTFSFRHNGKGNFLHMDLHVKAYEPDGELNTTDRFNYVP